MKTVLLGDSDSVLMFTLGGIESHLVENQQDAQQLMKTLLKNKTIGLLVVTAKVASWVPDLISARRFSRDLPLVLDIPEYRNKTADGQSLAAYIREAVGIKI